MSEQRYTITLSNGTVLQNLRKKNGSFLSSDDISSDIFNVENLKSVIINDGEHLITHDQMALSGFMKKEDGSTVFALLDTVFPVFHLNISIKNGENTYIFDGIPDENRSYLLSEEPIGLDQNKIYEISIVNEEEIPILSEQKCSINIRQIENKKWRLRLFPISESRLELERIKANVDYISMISGIDIE